MSIPLPLGGRLEGQIHRLPVRVYYEDTDAAGIVYHASYLRFAERGRTEMLRAVGVELSQLQAEQGLVFVLHSANAQYRKPARLDDMLTVETSLAALGAASVKALQIVRRAEEGGEELFVFDALLACIDRSGRPARVPAQVKDKIKALVRET